MIKAHNIYSINSPDSQLGYYLAGLIEGDGNIWTPKTSKPEKRIYNPQITFTFNIKEKPLYDKLKTIFNTGSLYREGSTNACKYRIAEKNKLIEVINLINGKFRTPKLTYLHKAIDHINLVHNTNIKKLPLDDSAIDSNAWLAGFVDSDGSFQISLEGAYKLNTLQLKQGRVKCTFSIKQRMIDPRTGDSFMSIMSKIANHFECNVRFEAKNELSISAQANNKHHITKEYFNKYPLITSKYLDYLSFLQGMDYLGKRLTNKEIIEIQNIKNSMNNRRISFNWDHLNNFKTAVS